MTAYSDCITASLHSGVVVERNPGLKRFNPLNVKGKWPLVFSKA